MSYLAGKRVLITGGTGSFGQSCVRALLDRSEARRVIVLSRDELKQSQMMASHAGYGDRIAFFLGDVRDKERLDRAFQGVDIVIHAAALKHVPLLEYSPFEAVQTNIIGTQNVINAAIDNGVERVMFLSTDKAASPANLYGATKLCAEKICINANAYGAGKTRISCVRYGNVLGSRGSILHVIETQKKNGVVHLTHEEMTRFWITIDQGVSLVLNGLREMRGGEIFIPKIPSMKVADLIRVCAPGCEIKVIGIRPGEKLHETLVTTEEMRHTVEFPDCYVVHPEGLSPDPWIARGARSVDAGFVYSSDRNPAWLDERGLRELIAAVNLP
ncbi:UDP-N-acetylglucosamine 4,6-dehydratase (inverting) [Candidatus Uhrbacteria bacterium]|nr:MAG: UDP-N-acetylglucosamine 4,6-dehydratase (inverting) [Candidatus Uhrbacteria bacterium]